MAFLNLTSLLLRLSEETNWLLILGQKEHCFSFIGVDSETIQVVSLFKDIKAVFSVIIILIRVRASSR